MERLTKRTKSNVIHDYEPTEYGNELDRTDLLGDYEDTGLTPEEIYKLKKSDADKERYTIELYNRARDAEDSADYWKREALKWCNEIGEQRIGPLIWMDEERIKNERSK